MAVIGLTSPLESAASKSLMRLCNPLQGSRFHHGDVIGLNMSGLLPPLKTLG